MDEVQIEGLDRHEQPSVGSDGEWVGVKMYRSLAS